MLGLDPARENFGWIGAAAADLVDPDFDALYAALTCSGSTTLAPLTMEDGTTPLTAEDGTTPLTDEIGAIIWSNDFASNMNNWVAFSASTVLSGGQLAVTPSAGYNGAKLTLSGLTPGALIKMDWKERAPSGGTSAFIFDADPGGYVKLYDAEDQFGSLSNTTLTAHTSTAVTVGPSGQVEAQLVGTTTAQVFFDDFRLYYAGAEGFDAEKIAGRTLSVSGATVDTSVFYAYGSSMKCSGVQYADLAIAAPGYEDFGIRCRYRPLAHTGQRNVIGLSNGAVIVQLDATNKWQVMESSAKTSSVTATVGTWYDIALEREGLTFVLKVNEQVVLTWNTSFNGVATAVRIGSSDAASQADGNYNDVRYYTKGVTAVRKLNKRPMTSRLRGTLCGVGRV